MMNKVNSSVSPPVSTEGGGKEEKVCCSLLSHYISALGQRQVFGVIFEAQCGEECFKGVT